MVTRCCLSRSGRVRRLVLVGRRAQHRRRLRRHVAVVPLRDAVGQEHLRLREHSERPPSGWIEPSEHEPPPTTPGLSGFIEDRVLCALKKYI